MKKIVLTRRIVWNKNNGQANISLPKKKMPFLIGKKKIKFEIRW